MKSPSTLSWHLGLIVVLASVVLFTNLGGARLWDDDESRNTGCALEMMQRGDWIVPTFNAELRTHKPVLVYWCMRAAFIVGGANEFTARLPSALGAMGTIILTYAMGRRLFNPRVGLWAAIALTCSITFTMTGRAATPDGVLIFTSTLAMAIFVFGVFARRKSVTGSETDADQPAPLLRYEGHWFPQRPGLVVLMYAAMGLAVLAKGPVGLVLPTAVIGMFLLIQRLPTLKAEADAKDEAGELTRMLIPQWLANIVRPFAPLHFLRTCWAMWPITAIVMTLLVAGPWYAAVGYQTDGEFLRGFFIEHNIKRAQGAMEGHSGFVGFYPAMLIAGFFPWSIFAIPVVIETVRRFLRNDPWQPGYLLATCWVGVYVILFSIARTKLANYITPCYPGVALLMGAYVERWLAGKQLSARWWPAVSFACLALDGGGLIYGGYLVGQKWLPGEQHLGLIGLLPLVAGVVALGRHLLDLDRRWTAGILTAALVPMTTLVFAVGAQRADAHRHDQELIADVLARGDKPKLATFRILEPSWVYYAKQPIAELPKRDPRNKAELLKQDVHVARMNECKQAALFFTKNEHAYMITTRGFFETLKPHLPPDVQIVAEQPRFLKDEKLVAIGRPAPTILAETPGTAPAPKR